MLRKRTLGRHHHLPELVIPEVASATIWDECEQERRFCRCPGAPLRFGGDGKAYSKLHPSLEMRQHLGPAVRRGLGVVAGAVVGVEAVLGAGIDLDG